SSFLETAYLIVKGELPTASHFRMWQRNIKMHTLVHENLKQFIQGFRYDAHPMGILIGTVGALSTFYPEAKNVMDLESRRVQTRRRRSAARVTARPTRRSCACCTRSAPPTASRRSSSASRPASCA